MSDYLSDEMERAIVDARASGWSQDGQIYFVRGRMEAAYERVRQRIAAAQRELGAASD